MTPRSLFLIILRVVGLFLLVDVLRVLPQLFSNITYFFRTDDMSAAMIGLVASVIVLLIYGAVLTYALFKADRLVDKLSLAKNFTEEKFELNIHSSTVTKIAIMLVGGVTLVNYFVPLVLNLFVYIQNKTRGPELFEQSVSELTLVSETLMVLLGYFLVTNSRFLTNLIEKARRKN